jgi:hypothetical protein
MARFVRWRRYRRYLSALLITELDERGAPGDDRARCLGLVVKVSSW